MKNKISLDTMKDVTRFVNIATKFIGHEIVVTDGNNMRVNAKSMLGMLYALEFDEMWVESDIDIYSEIEQFIV